MVVTFVATLALPVAAAVAVGVICSLLLQLNREQMDLRVVRLTRNEAGLLVEQPVPATLPDAEPVVLDVYGSLLYAGARTLGARLPEPTALEAAGGDPPAARPDVTGLDVLRRDRQLRRALDAAGGRLYLSGVQQQMVDRFHHSQVQDVQGKIKVFHATEVIGASTIAALRGRPQWLVGPDRRPQPIDRRRDQTASGCRRTHRERPSRRRHP